MNKILMKHKIVNVEIRHLKGCYPRYHGKNAVKGDHGYGREIAIAVLTTDTGVQGGENYVVQQEVRTSHMQIFAENMWVICFV